MSDNSTVLFNGCVSAKSKSIPIAKVVIISAVFLLGVFGNSFVIFLVSKAKRLHKQMCYLIANNAFADIIVLSLGLREWLNLLLSNSVSFKVGGTLGVIACKLTTLLQLVAPIVSITSMLVISIERLRAVTSPVRVTPIKKGRFITLLAGSWFLPSAIYCYTLYVFDIVYHKGEALCVDAHMDRQGWVLYHFVFYAVMVVLFLLLIFLNLFVIRKLRTSQNTISLPDNEMKKRSLRFIRAVQMVATSCALFGITWGPRSCLKFLDHLLFLEFSICRDFDLYFTIDVLFYMNFVFSPLLYFLFLSDFRDAAKEFKERKFSTSTTTYSTKQRISERENCIELHN